jgi:hypothetical protein
MLPYRNSSIPGREPFRRAGWRGQPRTLVGGEWRLGAFRWQCVCIPAPFAPLARCGDWFRPVHCADSRPQHNSPHTGASSNFRCRVYARRLCLQRSTSCPRPIRAERPVDLADHMTRNNARVQPRLANGAIKVRIVRPIHPQCNGSRCHSRSR